MTMETAVERVLFSGPGRTLIIRPSARENPDTLFDEVIASFDNARIEQDWQGNILVMAPTGGESSDQNAEITAQLRLWAKVDGRGRSFDSSVLFRLPDGSKMGPDASWVSNEQLKTLTPSERRKFLLLVPEFVVELKSPSDRLADLEMKMETWRRHGVALGWLINPEERQVKIYRAGTPKVVTAYADTIEGSTDSPVGGFVLNLIPIWAGLDV